MKTIKVGFSKPKKFKLFAWLISKCLGTEYDHVYVKFHSDTYDRDIIYQASQLMVNFMGAKIFESSNIIVKEFIVNIPDEHYIGLMQFCIDWAGNPYSLKEAFGVELVNIAALFGKKIENPFKEGYSICSVLGAAILTQFCDIKIDTDVQNIDPKDLYEILEKLEQSKPLE